MRDGIEAPGRATSRSSPASCAGSRSGSTTRSGCGTPQFDIERHVHRLALPTPGGYAELTELSGHLAGPPARPVPPAVGDVGDRGLPDDEDGRDLVAVFQKMHHATVDGVSGANLISHLCSLEPDAEPLGAQQEKKAWPHEPGHRRAVRARAGHQRHPAVHDLRADGADPAGRRSARSAGPARVRRWRPRSPLRARRSTAPSPATARSRSPRWTSTTIKEVKAATGTTVNDVVLAVAGGALRSYLEDRDELPESSLLATVPVSVRSESSALRRQPGLGAVHPARHRRRGPAGAAPGHGHVQPERQGPPQGDQRRRAAGLGRVRGAAHLRPRGPRLRLASAWPRSTRWCTTW